MNLKESLRAIEKATSRVVDTGWETLYGDRLNYNEMYFIPHLKNNKANRKMAQVPLLSDTITKLSDCVETIKNTDVQSFSTVAEINLYGSHVYPSEMDKQNITKRTLLDYELNKAWLDFYSAEMNGSSAFDKDVSDYLEDQIISINRMAEQLENQHVNINKFLIFNYTVTNQLAISLQHEDDRAYVAESAINYITNNLPDIAAFKSLYADYVAANDKFLTDVKAELVKINPDTFVTNADLFISTLAKNSGTNAVEGFLIEKMLTDDSVITSVDFTAGQSINKAILFDDASIAYKQDGQYHTFKDNQSLEKFMYTLNHSALSYILRKKPTTIPFFKEKLIEDKNYNNAISAATSFIDNYTVLKQYNYDLNSFKDKSFEAIDDEINHVVEKNKIKQYAFSILSAKNKHLFNDETEPYFKALFDNNVTTSQLQTFVGKKLAALHSNEDVITMLNGIRNHFDGFTQEALTLKLEAFGIEKLHDQNNVVTFAVANYVQCEALGSTSWCIVRDQEYYDQYVTDHRNIQYMMYDFNKPSTDINSMIGFTVDRSGVIYAEHLKNDDAIHSYSKDEQLTHIQTNTIYQNRKNHKLSEETLFSMEETLGVQDVVKNTKTLKMRNI